MAAWRERRGDEADCGITRGELLWENKKKREAGEERGRERERERAKGSNGWLRLRRGTRENNIILCYFVVQYFLQVYACPMQS
jgi:hypothetical protein